MKVVFNMNKQIDLFHKRVERLKSNTDFFVNSRVNIKYEKGKGIYTEFKGPDIKTIKAFLLDFRPFILNDEAVGFDHISNTIYQLTLNTSLREKITKGKKTWSDLLERKHETAVGGLRLQIDGKKLLSKENLDMWLNADFFHLDDEKLGLLESISNNPMGQLSYFFFIDLLQRLSELLFWFDKNVIQAIQTDNQYEK
jgi:hypothetical protein